MAGRRLDAAAARVLVARAGSGERSDSSEDVAGDRGRRVVVPAGAQAGELLLRDAPAAAVLQSALWATHCHKCFRAGDGSVALSRCGRCQTAYYCA